MVAFPFRMGSGFAGEVNRSHPASIEPGLYDPTNPPPFYGGAVMFNAAANSYRSPLSGDSSADTIAGVAVRPFPFQQASASNYGSVGIGGFVQTVPGAGDVLKSGYIMVPVVQGATALAKGNRVYIWVAASTGSHVQGGFETDASGGNTIELDEKSYFNGPGAANPGDTSGLLITELAFNL